MCQETTFRKYYKPKDTETSSPPAQTLRLGCQTDYECAVCRFDSYCMNWDHKEPPFVCHGDSAPRYFPGCYFTLPQV